MKTITTEQFNALPEEEKELYKSKELFLYANKWCTIHEFEINPTAFKNQYPQFKYETFFTLIEP